MSKASDSILLGRLLMKLSTSSVSPRLLWPGLKAILAHAVNSLGSRMLRPTYYLWILEYPKDLYYVQNCLQCMLTIYGLSLPPGDITDACVALNLGLLEITRWCCENSLLINPAKTKLLVIGVPQLSRNLPRLSICILGKEIEPDL